MTIEENKILEVFNNLLLQREAVACIRRVSSNNGTPFAAISGKESLSSFIDAINQSVQEDEDPEEKEISSVKSFDYGFKLEIAMVFKVKGEEEGGDTYEVSFCTQY